MQDFKVFFRSFDLIVKISQIINTTLGFLTFSLHTASPQLCRTATSVSRASSKEHLFPETGFTLESREKHPYGSPLLVQNFMSVIGVSDNGRLTPNLGILKSSCMYSQTPVKTQKMQNINNLLKYLSSLPSASHPLMYTK